jgi:deazaflavin-dependent oxidoreductase (nitroreductase family)
MTNSAAPSFEQMLIDDMRAHGGQVTTGPLAGHPILILTSTGARSAEPREALLTWSRDGGDYIVAGTAGGSPTTPAWVENVRRYPHVTIEVGNRTFDASATVRENGDERDRLWAQHVERLPHFGEYSKKTDRVFPVVRLTPGPEHR